MITQNPLIGRSKQKLGGAVATSWKGRNVLKSKPITVANPNTDAQQGQRGRMTALVAIYRLIAGVIQYSFKSAAATISEYNAFVQENMYSGFITNSGATITKDWSKFITGKGTIGSTPVGTITASNGSANVTVEWDGTVLPVGGSANDKAYVVVYNSTKDEFGTASAIDIRSTESTSVTMPSNCSTSDALKVYLSFSDSAQAVSGNSAYKAKTV